MNDLTKGKFFWILQAVRDGQMAISEAEFKINAMISDIEDDAFTRGQDSIHGAYNNLV